MNWDLFAAFLVITAVLIVVPGPIVTLIIATGARHGVRAALVTVGGTSIGNAVLLTAIAFGLGWVLQNAERLFEILRFVGAAYLIWLGIQVWRHAGETKPVATSGRINFTGGFLVALSNPKTIAFFTAVPAAIRRSAFARSDAARRHVHGHGAVGGFVRHRLGDRLRHDRGEHGPRLVHAAGQGKIARPDVGRCPGRRRHLAVARPPYRLTAT
jgi:LysE type translocator